MACVRPNPFHSPFDKLRANGSGRGIRFIQSFPSVDAALVRRRGGRYVGLH